MALKKPLDKRKARKRIIRQLDDIVREIVFIRDEHTCQYCGRKPKKLDPHHIYTRRIYPLRWEPDNLVTLCSGCHMHIAHGDPIAFMDFLLKWLGEETIGTLKLKRNNKMNTNPVSLGLLKQQLERDLENINNRR